MEHTDTTQLFHENEELLNKIKDEIENRLEEHFDIAMTSDISELNKTMVQVINEKYKTIINLLKS